MRTHVALSLGLLLAVMTFMSCEQSPLKSPTDPAVVDTEVISALEKKGGGKGKSQPDPSITVEFGDAATDNIRSDEGGIYVDGVCNVDATFNLNDARLSLKGKIRKKDQAACGDPRVIKVSFAQLAAGSPERSELDGTVRESRFMKVNEVETVTTNEWEERTAVLYMPGCAHGLKFNPNNDPKSSTVDVRKNSDGTWTVKTRPDDNVAVCIPDEDQNDPPPRTYWHMPFEITVK